jgi:hypothetical protein
MAIIFQNEPEKPIARPAGESIVDRTPIVVRYRDTTISWCQDRISELEKVRPYAYAFGWKKELEHIQKILADAIIYLSNGKEENLRLLQSRAIIPILDKTVIKTIFQLAQEGKANFDSFYNLPAWHESEKKRKIQEESKKAFELKQRKRDEAAKAEQERIAAERKFYLSKIGLSEKDVEHIKGEQ